MEIQTRGSHWVVGVDAGATSTKGTLVNMKGEELAGAETTAFNLRFQKVDEFEETMFGLIYDLINRAHLGGHVPGAIGIGVAGAGRPQDREMLRDAIANRFQQSHVLLHHDAFIAHYGAFSGQPGVLVTAGTGSIAFGRNAEGEEARAGGWGWMLGDEGSGWWIGREAIRAALAAWEGSGPETAIEPMIRKTFDLSNTYDVIPHLYHEKISRRDVTTLAEPVGDLAKQGDSVAQQIYHEAGRQIGKFAVITAGKLAIPREKLRVSLLGSIAVGDWELLEKGVWELIDEYDVGESGEAKAGEDVAAGDAEKSDSETQAVETIQMPVFPARDLTIDEPVGPHLLRPEMSSVRGAAQWAIDTLQQQQFA